MLLPLYPHPSMTRLGQKVLFLGPLRASEEGPPAILATIDRTPYTITESLVRSQLQLDDDGGVEEPNPIFTHSGNIRSMDNLGYPMRQAVLPQETNSQSLEDSSVHTYLTLSLYQSRGGGESSGEAAPLRPRLCFPEDYL
ncbi:hypothetical protein Tco_0359373 [Tanacetum coccineum]